MSSRADQLFSIQSQQEAKQPAMSGLSRALFEIGAELKRHGVQGSTEIANALFHESNSFVLYGRGQASPSVEQSQEQGRER